jgi:hypothetical protein
MITREEFVAETERYQQQARRGAWMTLVGVYAFFGVDFALIIAMERMHVTGHSTLFVIPIVVLFVGLIVLGMFETSRQKGLARKFGVQCLACGKPLRPRDIKLAIATHNCPYCGLPIFQE